MRAALFAFALALFAARVFAAPTDGYVACAKEGEQCSITTPGNVIYGAVSSYTAPKHIDLPGILCSNANFTDPINGTAKTCWFRADASPPIAAQVDVCTGQPIPAGTTSPLYRDFKEWHGLASPLCAPIKSDTATGPFEEHNAAGIVVYSYCKVEGKWRKQWGAATWDFLIGKNMAANAKAALASSTPLTMFQQLTLAAVTTPMSDPSLTAVWCPALANMQANRPADDVTPPPPPVAVYTHAVKANGASADRPAYKLINGVRGTATVARATVGMSCNLTRPTLASGTDVWAEFGPDFAPGVVALCSRKT